MSTTKRRKVQVESRPACCPSCGGQLLKLRSSHHQMTTPAGEEVKLFHSRCKGCDKPFVLREIKPAKK